MGLKRITLQAEIVYPADDERSVDELKTAAVTVIAAGVMNDGGAVARAAVVGASQDPDPEPVAEDVVPSEPVPEVG